MKAEKKSRSAFLANLPIGLKVTVVAENLGVKNAKWDREDGYVVPRNCYNSYFYRVEDDGISVIDKFMLHGDRLTKYLDGRLQTACYTFAA